MNNNETLTYRVLNNLPPEVVERDFDTILGNYTTEEYLDFVGSLTLDFIRLHPAETLSASEMLAVIMVLEMVKSGLQLINPDKYGKEG